MYKIEQGRHGFTLTFEGALYSEELSRWLEESKRALANRRGVFGVVVDMRDVFRRAWKPGNSFFRGRIYIGRPDWYALP